MRCFKIDYMYFVPLHQLLYNISQIQETGLKVQFVLQFS